MKRLSEEFASDDLAFQVLDSGRADMGHDREQALLAQVLLAAGVPVATLAASTSNASAATTAATSSGKAAGVLASSGGKIALLAIVTVAIGVSAWRYLAVTPSEVAPSEVSSNVIMPSAASNIVTPSALTKAPAASPALVVLAEPMVSAPPVGSPTQGIDEKESVATNAAETTPDKVSEFAKSKPVAPFEGPRKKQLQQAITNEVDKAGVTSEGAAAPIVEAADKPRTTSDGMAKPLQTSAPATTTLEANPAVDDSTPLPDNSTPAFVPPSTKPKSSPQASTLAEEARQLRRTRSLISSGNWKQAEGALSRYRRQFPKGVLAQDMGYLGLQIIATLHPRRLSSKVSQFLERHPSSPYRDKVRRLLE